MPEFTINISGLEAVRKRFQDVHNFLGSREPMEAIVGDIKEGILTKTAQGYDYMGRRFKPYSKAYVLKKMRTRVNLRVTGEMLDSIDTEVSDPRHGKVFVGAGFGQIIAHFHNQGGPKQGRPPKREFMNISKSALKNLIKKHIDDPIMKLLGRR